MYRSSKIHVIHHIETFQMKHFQSHMPKFAHLKILQNNHLHVVIFNELEYCWKVTRFTKWHASFRLIT